MSSNYFEMRGPRLVLQRAVEWPYFVARLFRGEDLLSNAEKNRRV
jgi:hypothetical protein